MKILYVFMFSLVLYSCATTDESRHHILASKLNDQLGLNAIIISWLESDLEIKSAEYLKTPERYQGFPEYRLKSRRILNEAIKSLENISLQSIKSNFTTERLEALTKKRDKDIDPLESSAIDQFKLELSTKLSQHIETEILPPLWNLKYEYEDNQFVKYIKDLSEDSKNSFAQEAADCASFYKTAVNYPDKLGKFTYMDLHNRALNTIKLLSNSSNSQNILNLQKGDYTKLFDGESKDNTRVALRLLICSAVVEWREERAGFWKEMNSATIADFNFNEFTEIQGGISLDNNKSLIIGTTKFYPTELKMLASGFYDRYKVLSAFILDNKTNLIKFQAYPHAEWIYKVIGVEQMSENNYCVLGFSKKLNDRDLDLVVYGIDEKGETKWASYPSSQLQDENLKSDKILQNLDNVAITSDDNNCVVAYTTITNENRYDLNIISYSVKGTEDWSKTINDIVGSSIIFKHINGQDYYVGIQKRSANNVVRDMIRGIDKKSNSVGIYLYEENNNSFSRNLYSVSGDIGAVKIMFLDSKKILIARNELTSPSILLLNVEKDKTTSKSINIGEYDGIYNIGNKVVTLFKNELSVSRLVNQKLVKIEYKKFSHNILPNSDNITSDNPGNIAQLADNRYLLYLELAGAVIIDTTDVR